MKLSREATARIRFLIDECLPPIVRDARWFVRPALRMLMGDKANLVLDFKQRALTMSDAEFAHTYSEVMSSAMERASDLNDACAEAILQDAVGEKVLEVGCGRGWLAAKLAARHKVTAVDIVIETADKQKASGGVTWQEASAEKLPFPDAAFDTVVSAHMLEHVKDVPAALSELRRVCKRRLILVVPRQRPYRYTFDLHLSFFPYAHSFWALVGTDRGGELKELDGDWYYREDV